MPTIPDESIVEEIRCLLGLLELRLRNSKVSLKNVTESWKRDGKELEELKMAIRIQQFERGKKD